LAKKFIKYVIFFVINYHLHNITASFDTEIEEVRRLQIAWG